MKMYRMWCLGLFAWLALSPGRSEALLIPGILLGGQTILEPQAGALPGARGTAVMAEIGWLWELEKVGLGIFLPLETDLGSRLAIGPRFVFEAGGVFRAFTAAKFEFGSPFSFFFLRWGLSLGWRNTGKRPSPPNFPVQAGAFLFAALDYRIKTTAARDPIPQYWRVVVGLRLELGFTFGDDGDS